MPGAARELLKRLEPAVRPPGSVALPRIRASAGFDFARLLRSAERGELRSERLPDVTAIDGPLDAEALTRLGGALDCLEATGARRAVLLYGGRGFIVEVSSRRFEIELAAQEPPIAAEVDAALRVAAPGELPGEASAWAIGPPRGPISCPSLSNLLAARDSQGDSSESPLPAAEA